MKTLKKIHIAALRLTAGAFALACIAVLSASCAGKSAEKAKPEETHIAVFVPGIVSGSPVYEMLVSGVRKAVDEAAAQGKSVSVDVVEGGTKQADWGSGITALAADGKYALIISSNPAIPQICAPIAKKFTQEEFLVFDAYSEGTPQITTFQYNQREQAYVSGYMAALVSSSSMKFANMDKKIGLVAAQEYPAMNDVILPSFLEGAKAVDPAYTVDFRVVGNWYDAAKGAELAKAMKSAGVDVIMPIAGGANQGVVAAAKEDGFYVAWFDNNGYAQAPGLVIASSVMAQERLAYEKTKAWLDGSLEKGKPMTVGMKDGYVDFVSEDPLWAQAVPEELRAKQLALVDKIRSGSLDLGVK